MHFKLKETGNFKKILNIHSSLSYQIHLKFSGDSYQMTAAPITYFIFVCRHLFNCCIVDKSSKYSTSIWLPLLSKCRRVECEEQDQGDLCRSPEVLL